MMWYANGQQCRTECGPLEVQWHRNRHGLLNEEMLEWMSTCGVFVVSIRRGQCV
jgi:hypothetical protein